MTGTATATGAGPSGSDCLTTPPIPGGVAMAWSASNGREKSSWLAGHCGIALLDHAPSCEGFSGPCGSGRIAQLVEQLTLNQRVPGSSPGAPTKQIKHLQRNLLRTDLSVGRSVGSFCSPSVRNVVGLREVGWLRVTAAATSYSGCVERSHAEALATGTRPHLESVHIPKLISAPVRRPRLAF